MSAIAPKPEGTGLSGRSALSRISSRKAAVAATRDLFRGSLKTSLRRWHAACPRVGRRGHAQCLGEGLEHRLRLMVRVLPTQVVEVQGRQRVIDEALEELVHEIDVESADHRPRERYVILEPRAAGEIDDRARQRLVERYVGVAVTDEARLVAERLLDRL